MLRACGADEKERVACAIHKLKVVVHAVVLPVVHLDAKNALRRHEAERGVSWAYGWEKSRTRRTKERYESTKMR